MNVKNDMEDYVIDDIEYDIEQQYKTITNTIIGYHETLNIKEQLENMKYGE